MASTDLAPLTLESVFKLLSDITRLRCLNLLLSAPELCVCDLTEVLQESQPKISRHLHPLRQGGIVTTRKAGLWVHYSINPDLQPWAKNILRDLAQAAALQSPFQQDLSALTQGSTCKLSIDSTQESS